MQTLRSDAWVDGGSLREAIGRLEGEDDATLVAIRAGHAVVGVVPLGKARAAVETSLTLDGNVLDGEPPELRR